MIIIIIIISWIKIEFNINNVKFFKRMGIIPLEININLVKIYIMILYYKFYK